MNHTVSQEKRILNHLKGGKKLTLLGAFTHFNCLNLKARIFDLRKKGINVKSRTVKIGNNKRVSEYYL